MFGKQSVGNQTLLILLACSILILIVFSFLGARQSEAEEALQAELQQEIASLEGSLVELNDMNDGNEKGRRNAEADSEAKKEQLAKMASKIGGLEEKVAQMAKEGTADKALIKKLQEKLAQAKSILVENYKKEINILFTDNRMLMQMKDDLEYELMVKDSLCRLEDRDNGLKPWLKAENILFTAIRSDNEQTGNTFRQNRLETLKVVFDLVGMGPVPNNTKNLYLVIESDNRQTLQDAQKKSSWFNFKGKDIPYSSKSTVEYEGTPIKLEMFFDPQGNRMNKGTYQVKIFSDFEFIGQREVVIT